MDMQAKPQTQISSLEELVEELEIRKEAKRERISQTRTKQEGYEVKGEMLGIDEALSLLRQFIRNQA